MLPSAELLELVEARLVEARHEIASLEAARAALSSPTQRTAASTPTARRSSRSRRPLSSPGERSGRDSSERRAHKHTIRRLVAAATLEQLLSETNGLSTATLAERADARPDQVLAELKQLEASGRVLRTGQRRSTRWHLITDEDRIERRAAELQAQSRAAA